MSRLSPKAIRRVQNSRKKREIKRRARGGGGLAADPQPQASSHRRPEQRIRRRYQPTRALLRRRRILVPINSCHSQRRLHPLDRPSAQQSASLGGPCGEYVRGLQRTCSPLSFPILSPSLPTPDVFEPDVGTPGVLSCRVLCCRTRGTRPPRVQWLDACAPRSAPTPGLHQRVRALCARPFKGDCCCDTRKGEDLLRCVVAAW